MTAIQELDAKIRSCTLCAERLARHPVNPPDRTEKVVTRPVLSEPHLAPIMLVGQAPGLTEYDSSLPFQGPAGAEIRALFSTCGVHLDEFNELVYQTSAVKCFPGRKRNGERWEDRQPDSKMLNSCGAFLQLQLEIVDPAIVVCLGRVAAHAINRMRGRPMRNMSDLLGTMEEWGLRKVVYLTHIRDEPFTELGGKQAPPSRGAATI